MSLNFLKIRPTSIYACSRSAQYTDAFLFKGERVEFLHPQSAKDKLKQQKTHNEKCHKNIDIDVFYSESEIPFIQDEIYFASCNTMSRRTKSKIRDRVNVFYALHKKRYGVNYNLPVFCTLTLPCEQIYSDKEYTRYLNSFLTRIREKYKVNYLWVAERQEGERLPHDEKHNATLRIHFHILFDRYLPVTVLNYWWCSILKNSGHDVDLNRMPTSKSSKGSYNPVDIKYVFNLKSLALYLSKYVTKNKTSLSCQLWNCSKVFSNLVTSVTMRFRHDMYDGITKNNYTVNTKTGEVYECFNPIYITTDKGHVIGKYLPLVRADAWKYWELVFNYINQNIYDKFRFN